ncbi:MAG: carboxypeptidase regulatory-like domain-containing protein [Bryobacterales bacterium]|nr:carboxypeptidase regulatory-like domain-containing protein [Bryobacterales bacterium]
MNRNFKIWLGLLLAPLAMQAQESRGTILGRIVDPSGAVVAGVSIQAVNVDTKITLRTTSNEAGNYQIPFVVPGNYRIEVSQPGFRTLQRDGIRVLTGTQVTVDLQLELGAASDSVTVVDSAPLLNPASGDLGQVLDNRILSAVTIGLGKNVLYAVRLAPGVNSGGGSVTGNGAGNYQISGGGSTDGRVEYLIDGIPNTVAQNSGGVVYIPSIDAVEEIKVQTTMFDAAYGHSNSGAINITTKGGTNTPHGTVYMYKQWGALNANSWANNRNGIRKPTVHYYQYGYLFGGPVYIPRIYNGRNRTFFSTTLERDNDPRTWMLYARVPTTQERQGNFSQTLGSTGLPLSIYNPYTTTVSGTRATRQPFANATIPASQLSPTGVAWLKLLPEPNMSGTPRIQAYNWLTSGLYYVKQTQVSVRIDHNISDRQRIFGRYGHLFRDQNFNPIIVGQTSIPPEGTSNLEYLTRGFSNVGLDDTYTFSPSFIGSLRYGFVRKTQRSIRGAVGLPTDSLGLPTILTANQATNGWPTFNLGENIPTLGSQLSFVANEQHSLMAAFTKLTGKHSLKFGIDYRLQRYNQNSPGSAAPGNFTFNSVFTRADAFTASSSDTTGTAMASLLLGLPASGSLGSSSALSFQNHYLAAYVQEDWKVSRRLTLNFGLRYDVETPWTERYNRMSYGFDETAKLPVQVPGLDLRGGILFAGTGGNPRRGGPVDRNNLGPRFGFAVTVAPRTVVRGGYGLFYSAQTFNTSYMGDLGVFNSTTPFTGSIDNGATPYATLANPFPAGLRQATGSSAGLMAQAGDTLSFLDGGRVSPYSQQWQLSLQHEFPSQVLAEAAYVGMLSLKQFESFNLNEKPDRYLALGAAENNRVNNPFLNLFPATSTLGQGSTITQNRLWVQYPQFTSLTVQGANTGRSIYHALQTKVEKRLTHGLALLFTYTWAKLIDNETTSIVNERHYRTVSGFDVPHMARLVATYEFPWRITGNGWNRLLDKVAGGWSLSAYFVRESGGAMGVTGTNGRPIRLRNAALSGPISDRLGDRRDAKGNILNPYFDITAFAPLPTQYMVSPEPPRYSELRAPATQSLNLSLFKTFAIYERFKLQFRAEATGVTNSPNFSAPGTNLSSPTTFGVITSAGGARAMQGSLRLAF